MSVHDRPTSDAISHRVGAVFPHRGRQEATGIDKCGSTSTS
jgi:hypothetical protein